MDFPYFETEIDKLGNFVDPAQVRNLLDFLAGQGSAIRDLFVMSHGWNTNMEDARSLYRRFFAQFSKTVDAHAAPRVTAGQLAVVGILWPSMKFTDSALIPGGAAALDPAGQIHTALDQLAALAGPGAAPQIERARLVIASLDRDPGAQREFVDAVRSVLNNRHDEEGAQHLFGIDGDELLQRLRVAPRPADPEGPADPEEGGAAGLGDLFAGIGKAAEMLLNAATYYLMKDRAGIVGRGAVARMLGQVQEAFPAVRIHLAGHSFGCRVITSAVAADIGPVASMTLLQAAFSQNSFSPDFDSTHRPGGFRSVIAEQKCTGPILVTHTVRDLAVGIAYAVASRLAGQNDSAIGDASDLYGGLGRNGARHTPEASDGDLLREGSEYSFTAGHIANLRADNIIQSHADIVKPETVWALIAAAGLGRGAITDTIVR